MYVINVTYHDNLSCNHLDRDTSNTISAETPVICNICDIHVTISTVSVD